MKGLVGVASGGSRAVIGPAPNPNALRRERDSGSWTKLPAEGRLAPAPVFPLQDPSERELELWVEEWKRPQAIMWEKGKQELEVALYVRRLAEAEVPNSKVALGALVKQMQEILGVSVPGMHRNRWMIVHDQVVAEKKSAAVVKKVGARDRLKLVSDGTA